MTFPFLQNARTLRSLHEELHTACKDEKGGERHRQACKLFHDRYEELAFPGGLQNGLDQLSENDAKVIEQALRFLEFDPWFFRSGYAKSKMLRRLKHVDLSIQQRARLIKLIRKSLDNEIRSGFTDYASLAGVIFDSALINDVKAKSAYCDPIISARAKHLIHVWKSRRVLA